jgi:formylmethanofuran dehydrogenase subunit C
MPLSLHFKSAAAKSAVAAPINLSGLAPHWTRGRNLAEIGSFPVAWGNERISLGELFVVEGTPADERIELVGDLSTVRGIGAGMTSGSIRVEGNVGCQAGTEMSGGQLEIHGSAGDWVGSQMRGGRIHVHGSVADYAAGAYPGGPRGMTGGELLIGGTAGDGLGRRMRRGLVAVLGSAGEDLGAGLIAGTILVGGSCGRRPGAEMRRGTIALLGPEPELLPTFVRANRLRPQFMALLFVHLRQAGLQFQGESLLGDYVLHHGDMLASGRGEILVRA